MARQRHGDAPPPRKKASKKKAAKKVAKKSGKSLLERASAKKRTRAAAETMAPTKSAASKDKRLDSEIIMAKGREHPVDTIAKVADRVKSVHPRSPIEDERAKFRAGPLSDEVIGDICRMLRFSLHRETVERLLGLSRGRIKKWIRRGKESRGKIEAWHDQHDDMVQDGKTSKQAVKKLGEPPAFDIYATFHACVLEAEANGEKTAVAGIIDASIGAECLPPDWKAGAWLLSRKYNKRWGSYAEREMSEEEDQVDSGDGTKQKSAVDRLADTLDEMFGKTRAEP